MYRNRIPYKTFNFNNNLEKNKTVEYYKRLLKQKDDIEKSKEPPKPKNYYQKNS